MVQITNAATKILLEAMDPGDLVRVSVRGGGCAGFMYDLSIEEETSKGDVIVELDQIKVCMDPTSSFMLSETVIDYESTLTQSGFKFLNDQATKSCGCGQSFSC